MAWILYIILGALLFIASHLIMLYVGYDKADYKKFNYVVFFVDLIFAIAAFFCIGKGFHDRGFNISQRNLAEIQIAQESQ